MLVSSRTPFARALAVGAFAVVTAGVLVGCGSDDSTASSTPTLTTAAGSGSPTVPPLATGIEVPDYTTPSVAATSMSISASDSKRPPFARAGPTIASRAASSPSGRNT